jgi:hypothetical protein
MARMTHVMALAAVSALAAGPAAADIIGIRNNTNVQFASRATPAFINLTNAGVKSFTFTTTATDMVAVTFSAECDIQSAGLESFGIVEIVIDGLVVAPGSGDQAFCSWTGNSGTWRTQSITHARMLAPGTHTLQIRASYQGVAGGRMRLDDAATVVWN